MPLCFVFLGAGCGGQVVRPPAFVCSVAAQLPAFELRRQTSTERSSVRIESLYPGAPDVPIAGVSVDLPAGWRVSGASFERHTQLDASAGSHLELRARTASGSVSFVAAVQALPAVVSGKVVLEFPAGDSVPATEVLEVEGATVAVCAD